MISPLESFGANTRRRVRQRLNCMTTKPAPDALFVYGSLLEETKRLEILGHRVEVIAAHLENFERRRARYFYVIPAQRATTFGMAMLRLSDADWRRLDAYEEVPILYTREQVEVETAGGAWMLGVPSDGGMHQTVRRRISEDVALARRKEWSLSLTIRASRRIRSLARSIAVHAIASAPSISALSASGLMQCAVNSG